MSQYYGFPGYNIEQFCGWRLTLVVRLLSLTTQEPT
jgi:hypothetical protein